MSKNNLRKQVYDSISELDDKIDSMKDLILIQELR